MDMDMIKEYLKYLSPKEALLFIQTNRNLYHHPTLFNYLMQIDYPNVPTFGKPKEQFIALANNQSHLYYTKLMHMDSEKCPELIYKHLYDDKKKVPMVNGDDEDSEDDEDDLEVRVSFEVFGIKPPKGTILYVGVWVEYAYGEDFYCAYTIDDIVDWALKQLKTYNVIEEREAEFNYIANDKLKMFAQLQNEGQYCLVLHEHPLDEDLTAPVLTMRRVTIV